MLVPVFLALFLPCVGMSSVFVVYLCLLWYSASSANNNSDGNRTEPAPALADPVKPTMKKGLSESELEKIPKATGQQLVMGSECAVCLDDIAGDEPVRMLPGCNHGFHLACADTWLAKHPVCPLCRAMLDAQILIPPDDQNPC